MSVNIVIADELRLVRKGVISLINSMHYGEQLGNDPEGRYNIVADTATPNELVNILASHDVDLLILGYSLSTKENSNPISSLDGYALIKWLTKKYPALKIIVISPYKHPSLMRTVLEMGATGYISMNICEKTLERVIISVLNNEVYVEKGMIKSLFQGGNRNGREVSLKEMEVLRLLCKGLNLTSIANRMNLSIKTVSAHKLRAMNKLEVESDCQLYCLLTETKLFNVSF
ncbi:MAG: response regulator transcription factor [Rouxiella aceris]|uniref:response regulator transcription factor n=1 Tax=Rouxiella aceris TaxID=2703884 RepID=UPI00285103EE|nr:response regulator transcription factor [Rouxiella aceris]MDR3432784.1 response regulator transcription factor [Rouxiella aceris]